MASTRNLNTIGDYNLKDKQNKSINQHNLYLHSSYGRPNDECFPELYNPSKLSRDALANNSIDIESTLLGIGATNLVNSCEVPIPSLKKLSFKSYFDRNETIIMPYPLIFDNKQRPNLD